MQPVQTASVPNLVKGDCGLAAYPVSRSKEEMLADIPRNHKKAPDSALLAKVAIDETGKITHLRVIGLAHANAPNWTQINEEALNSIKQWHYKPTVYQGKAVPVCTDVSVIIDLF